MTPAVAGFPAAERSARTALSEPPFDEPGAIRFLASDRTPRTTGGNIEFGALSLLPPLLAIVLAIDTRQVYLSLAGGIWLGWTIIVGWNPLAGLAGAVDAHRRRP